jgi:predicted porin
MNKKLISIVIGAALAGGMTATASADVQLYGLLDASINSFDTDGVDFYGGASSAADISGADDINMNTRTSYVGVKGSEDLGNGLKAIFKLEFGVDGGLSEKGGLSNGRDKWVGVESEFGVVRLGTMATHYKDSGQALNVMSDTAFDLRGVSGYDNGFGQLGLMSGLHDGTGEEGQGRATNTVRFDTQDYNGLSGSVHYTFDGDKTPAGTEDEDPWGAGAQYKNGNIYAFGSYITTQAGGDDAAWKVGGSYTMGNASVFGQYEQGGLLFGSPVTALGLTSAQLDTFANDVEPGSSYSDFVSDASGDANQWMLGGTFTMGNTMMMAGYGQYDDDMDFLAYDVWQLAVKHSLSKRTALYAGFSQSSMDKNDVVTDAGEIDHFAIGVQHKF